jgi:hypothetical protein
VDLDEPGNAQFTGSACTSEPDMGFLIRVGARRWIATVCHSGSDELQ